jgi:hypothetical protein
MSDLPPHEAAYRAVVASQEAQARADGAFTPSTDSNKSTPFYVWGALFGLVVGAFGIDTNRPLWFLSPFVMMAFGAFLFWGFGKLLGLVLRTLFVTLPGLVFGKRKSR